ncbi:MAG TPA: SdrD B-like domain-containing protein [Rhodothermales bacterium]|nr:SdrD B-like domain-containing protein [Rhodothermales bacterium]
MIFIFIGLSEAHAQVTGAVFRDFDGNGTRGTNEPLVSGVTVTAYGPSGTSCGTTTTSGNTAPNYSLTGCGTGAVRVEFVLPSTGRCVNSGVDYASLSGTTYGTSVQFVNGNSTNVNFGVYNPANYNTGAATTSVVIPVHTNGNPLLSGTSQSDDWIVGFPYNNTGTTTPSQRLNGATVGATWGMAYSKQAEKVFTSAFIKRHVGLGALGSGGIYALSPTSSSFTVSNFFDFDSPTNVLLSTPSTVSAAPTRCASGCPAYGSGTSFNIVSNAEATYLGSNDPLTGQPLGLGVVGTNVQRGLLADKTQPSRDPAAMDQVGKVGLGDLDISDDGRFLFSANLYDRKIYRLTLNDPQNPTHITDIASYSLPSVTITNGVLRPFALKFYRDKLYVGAVATGENVTDDSNSNLFAYVFQLDTPTASAAFQSSPIITHQLNYNRGTPNSGSSYTGQDRWYPWSKSAYDFFGIARPSPMLTDIDFTDRGDIMLAFTDRFGHQYGHQNYRFLGNPGYSDLVTAQVAGDLIIAGINCSTNTFTMESNGSFTSNGQSLSGGTANGQGPGNGEFFNGENQNTTHTETSQGAIGVLFGQAQVMLTNMNPTTSIFSGGTKLMSTTNGASSNGYVLYNQNAIGDFGKANGLGDLEMIVPESPIEIGNRVWLDTDNDGIQDAGEAGISGVQVQLIKSGTTISTATTDTNGNYYFSSATGTDTASTKYGLTQLVPDMAYTVRFPTTATVAGTTYNLTTAAAGSNRLIDSNAPASGDVTILATDIPVSGANNHSFDVGYSSTPCAINTPTVTPTCNNNGTPSDPSDDTFTFTISATGSNTGANYKVDKIAPAPTSTVFASVNYGATSAASAAFPISGGNLTLTLTDNTTATCTNTPVTVTAPPTCSSVAPQADLELTKTSSSPVVRPGDTLTYTLTLVNKGPGTANGVVVRDVLPPTLTFVSATTATGSYNNATGLWTLGNIAPGTYTLTINVTVN